MKSTPIEQNSLVRLQLEMQWVLRLLVGVFQSCEFIKVRWIRIEASIQGLISFQYVPFLAFGSLHPPTFTTSILLKIFYKSLSSFSPPLRAVLTGLLQIYRHENLAFHPICLAPLRSGVSFQRNYTLYKGCITKQLLFIEPCSSKFVNCPGDLAGM